MIDYFVRLGCLGQIYPAQSINQYPRDRRVIVRTGRGVELAEIVRLRVTAQQAGPSANARTLDSGPSHSTDQEKVESPSSAAPTLQIIRGTTNEDELLISRLERHKRDAVESCRTALAGSGSRATLLDVDQIFDGGTLVMHFLGDVDDVAQTITQTVASEYESIIQSEAFAQLLTDGCGPDCGTSDGGGCGGSCSGCAVASACRTK